MKSLDPIPSLKVHRRKKSWIRVYTVPCTVIHWVCYTICTQDVLLKGQSHKIEELFSSLVKYEVSSSSLR